MYDQITASLFRQMVLHGAACIAREKQAVNDLNVFPVPDGDTGTNMSMTLAAAVTELQRTEPATVDQAASITAKAQADADAAAKAADAANAEARAALDKECEQAAAAMAAQAEQHKAEWAAELVRRALAGEAAQ